MARETKRSFTENRFNFEKFLSLFQPALPKVIDFDEDVDYEDEEEFMDHGHSLMDELELHLTSQDEMNKIV